MATQTSENLGLTIEDNDEFVGIETTAANFQKIDEAFGEVEDEISQAVSLFLISVSKNGSTVSSDKTFSEVKAQYEKNKFVFVDLTVEENSSSSCGRLGVSAADETALTFVGTFSNILWKVEAKSSGWTVQGFEIASKVHGHQITDVEGLSAEIEKKVSKVSGKGLSTEDYTTAEKQKLQGVEANANNYTLPKATKTTLGGIIPGRSLSADEDGKLSVAFAGTESINVAQVAATKAVLKELSGVSPVPAGSSLSGNYTSHYLDGNGLSFRNADGNNTDFTVYGRNGITTMDYNAVKNTLVTLGLNTVLTDLAHCYYSDGEKVTFYVNTSFAGFTGIERKYAHFFIPLNKSLDFVKSVSFSGKVTLRGVGGLLGGAEEFDLSSASKNTGVQQISAVFSPGGLRCFILFSNVITNSTANTPISVAPHGGNLVLTFSSQ